MKKLEDYVRSIPDFPEKGIIFRDLTSVLQDADGLHLAIDEMQKRLDGLDFDVIAGTESRGFILGMPLAYNLHKPFVLIRKEGKLPCETVKKEYDLEYGTAVIEERYLILGHLRGRDLKRRRFLLKLVYRQYEVRRFIRDLLIFVSALRMDLELSLLGVVRAREYDGLTGGGNKVLEQCLLALRLVEHSVIHCKSCLPVLFIHKG